MPREHTNGRRPRRTSAVTPPAASGRERRWPLEERMNPKAVGKDASRRDAALGGLRRDDGRRGLRALFETPRRRDLSPRDADLLARRKEGEGHRRRTSRRESGQKQRKAQAPVHNHSVPCVGPIPPRGSTSGARSARSPRSQPSPDTRHRARRSRPGACGMRSDSPPRLEVTWNT